MFAGKPLQKDFLTRFAYYVTDDRMNPYIPNKEAIRRLYDICKINNYFEKKNIMNGKLYKKVPLDYIYYYTHKNGLQIQKIEWNILL